KQRRLGVVLRATAGQHQGQQAERGDQPERARDSGPEEHYALILLVKNPLGRGNPLASRTLLFGFTSVKELVVLDDLVERHRAGYRIGEMPPFLLVVSKTLRLHGVNQDLAIALHPAGRIGGMGRLGEGVER